MGVKRIREDSIKELKKRKTNAQLQEENEQLREQLTDTQLALCDVYEALLEIGGEG